MAAPRPGKRGFVARVGRAGRWGARSAQRRLLPVLGGRTRTRVILVMACVLGLSSADTATVGAAATELRHALHISNTDIGLLVAVTAVVGAVFALPFGALTDRVRRTTMLGGAVALWGVAMVWSATAGSFSGLLYARLALGAVTAVAGPATASLVGDWFPGGERGHIYSYILTGELLGAGAGFAITGDIAAISWRAAFVVLAIPAFAIAWAVLRLPEPQRGGRGALEPEPGTKPWQAAQRAAAAAESEARSGADDGRDSDDGMTDAQRLAVERGIRPDSRLVRRADPRMGFISSVRYVLAVKTNVILIVSGACAYYFLSGVETFGVEFVKGQYHVSQVVANLLLIVVGAGAVVGVLVAGPLGDRLLHRKILSGRVLVAAVAASVTVLAFIPAFLTNSAIGALPYIVLAAIGLSAQNAPIDAARLDIMPSWLWGRAEGVRTFIRTGAQALAPLLFGAVSDYVFGGGTHGLYWTFVVMMVPLTASAFFLFTASRRYPRDVATAAAAPPAPGSGQGGVGAVVPAAPPAWATGRADAGSEGGAPGGPGFGPAGGPGFGPAGGPGFGPPGGPVGGPPTAVVTDATPAGSTEPDEPGETRWVGGFGPRGPGSPRERR